MDLGNIFGVRDGFGDDDIIAGRVELNRDDSMEQRKEALCAGYSCRRMDNILINFSLSGHTNLFIHGAVIFDV